MSGPLVEQRAYVQRALILLAGASIGSIGGSAFTWTNNNWGSVGRISGLPNPGRGLLGAVMFAGPPLLILASARLTRTAVLAFAGLAGIAMALMWWVFVNNDSSTSALIFGWCWIAGVPFALLVVGISEWQDGKFEDRFLGGGGPK